MRYLLSSTLSLLILFLSSNLNAQSDFKITGQLVDTVDYNFVSMTSVSIIKAQDSILQSFTRADDDGFFSLNVKEGGEYLIIVNHPTFATYINPVQVNSKVTDLGKITLITRKHLLQEVIISDEKAIMIKGDTVIYSADSFKVREFDNVDELLKRLPGIEVSANGTIKAHGENVQKMYVDGEEFFGDDPAILAKTIRASAIDKVQVYDDKSEMAKNTGVDDGERVKSINLTLKDHAKSGYMGKLNAGIALPHQREFQAMIQSYKSKRKLAAYFLAGTTNDMYMDWQDNRNYGSGSTMSMSEDGYYISTSESNNFSYDGNNGLPNSYNAGINYGNAWKDDKYRLNGGYTLSNITVDKLNDNTTHYILPDTQYINNQNIKETLSKTKHAISGRGEIKLDSLQTIKVNVNASILNSNTQKNSYSNFKDMENNILSQTTIQNSEENETKSTSASINYNKRFKKEGRSIALNSNINWNDNDGMIKFQSENEFNMGNEQINYEQNKYRKSEALEYGIGLYYTEPILKKTFLEIFYKINYNTNTSDESTYDIGSGEEVYNPLFSNKYEFNYFANNVGGNLRYSNTKLNSSIGLSYANTQIKQINELHTENNISYAQNNIYPRASVRYNFNKSTSLAIRYDGSTRQPSINQLQPLVINTDPSNIQIGNEDLKQEFRHSFNLNFNSYSVLKNNYKYIGLYGNIINKPIVTEQNITSGGIRTYRYINGKNGQSVGLYGGTNQKIIKNLEATLNLSGNYSEGSSYNNGLEDRFNNFSINPSININYNKDTTLNISYGFTPGFNNSYSKLRPDVVNRFTTYTNTLNFKYTLPFNITLSTDVNWYVRPSITENIEGTNVFQWNASLGKRMLKDRSLEAAIYCYDILNQNVGYNYYQTETMINQSNFNVIRQYFMLKITWNFTSLNKKQEEPAFDLGL